MAGASERMEVEPRRFNVFAQWGDRLAVTLSTHMDTVPPFFASREDDEFIWGRGACDTKGIIAAMIHAAEALLEAGEREFRRCCSWWARSATAPAPITPRPTPRGSRYSDQRRAHRKQAGARLEGRAAL